MILAAAEPVFLLSLTKPILFLLVLVAWGWIVGNLDKDAEYYFLKRYAWSGAHLGAGVVGFGLLLLVPIFWVGLPLALLILGGEIGGYIFYRNSQVPEVERWTLSLDSLQKRAGRMRQTHAQRSASLVLMARDDTRLDVPVGDDPNLAPHLALEAALDFALPRGAEQVDLVIGAEKTTFTARIDGVRHALPAIEPAVAIKLLDYLKGIAGLDLEDRRRKQTGTLRCDHHPTGRHTLELHTAGSTRGLSLTIRIDPGAQVGIPFEKLGLAPVQVEALDKVLNEKGGVVLISAPPKHGTTTTLYSLIQRHDPYTSSVMTWEDEIAYEVEGVSHNISPPGASPEKFNEKLGAMLRSDPDVMMLARLADQATARLAAKAAEEVRIYLPLPKEDAMASLKAWLKIVGDQKLAANNTRAVIAQRLVRRLCPTCKQAYTPDPAALKKLNVPADKVKQLYRASGKVADEKGREQDCSTCHGMGYRGRVAVFEVMALDQEARDLIAHNEADKLKAYLRKQRMLYLQEAALAKVVEGVTDIKEITRAMSEGKKQG